jgi:hypothetical protein
MQPAVCCSSQMQDPVINGLEHFSDLPFFPLVESDFD